MGVGLFNTESLIIILAVIAGISAMFSIYLCIVLVRIQKKLRSAFGSNSKSNKYALGFYLEQIINQKEILNLNTSSINIDNSSELTKVLTSIANLAYRLFRCQFVEISLIDANTEFYHTSCFVGEPLKKIVGVRAQHQDIKQISFSGERFGLIRLVFDASRELTVEEGELLDLLTLQAAIAILNAKFSTQLFKLKQSSEESVRAKVGFLANLSHELRGPLGIMLNAVEIVLSGICGDVNDRQDQTLTMVKKNGEHLLDLVNDVLDFAKIEAGKVIPDMQIISVDELIYDVGKLVNSQAHKKKHAFNYETRHKNLAIKCDRRHARQILINFLTNAIKYTPPEGKVDFWAERTLDGQVRIVVKDNGVGIPEDQKDKVFSAFERIDDEYSKEQMGTGLGLSLTVRLAEANLAQIGFDSVAGEGSEFYIVFDAEDASLLINKNVEVVVQVPRGHGEKVLLLEPNSEEASVVVDYLNNLGYQVESHSASFNPSLNEDPYSLVLLENSLVDDQGVDFVNNLRHNLKNANIPIIVMSSRAFDFDTESYLKMGIDICLNKPLKLSDLAQTVARVLPK